MVLECYWCEVVLHSESWAVLFGGIMVVKHCSYADDPLETVYGILYVSWGYG